MNKQFSSLTEFKRTLKVGDQVSITLHGVVQPTSQVTKAQSNSFAVERDKNGGKVNSWVDYPKAAHCRIEDNTLILLDKRTNQEHIRVSFAQ